MFARKDMIEASRLLKECVFDLGASLEDGCSGSIVRAKMLEQIFFVAALYSCSPDSDDDDEQALRRFFFFVVSSLRAWAGDGFITPKQAFFLSSLGFYVSPERVR